MAATDRLDWAAAKVAAVPGFRAARDVVELGAGDFSRSISLGRRYPGKRFVSTDYTISQRAATARSVVEAMPNVRTATVDARKIDLPPESVDLMFSIALMEHIAELADCLEAVHRALRPGGVYFFIQAPFWSCAQGHHFRHSDEVTYQYIPKYSHLTKDRDAFGAMLRNGPKPPFDIDGCVRSIFDRADLSRLGLRATRASVESGPLQVLRWQEIADRRYDDAAAKTAFPELLYPFRFEELAVSGAEVVLRKPGGSVWRAARQVLFRRRH